MEAVMSTYYIASCVFTAKFPALSVRIQDYVRERWQMPIVRCCVPRYKIKEFEEQMPEGSLRGRWQELPDCAPFTAGDTTYSLCHNCINIVDEIHAGTENLSLWELILKDDNFSYPTAYRGCDVTVQDCWRSRHRSTEQSAVREILTQKLGMNVHELSVSHERTQFCGISLLRPQPPRNPKIAPKFYTRDIADKFHPHTPEEQKQKMDAYATQFTTNTAVCYCHYCHEGLSLTQLDTHHLAQLLFAG